MKIRNVSIEEVEQALERVNKAQGYRLIFNREPEKKGSFVHCTIRSEKSKIHGASVSWQGRNSPSASWEAHGYFFEELFKIRDSVTIDTRGKRMYSNNDNWDDFNIGSRMYPFFASDNAYFEEV